ncbi:conserved hypothetical protein [Leishmania major strain Friedlin]|uniref:Transmembrane protein n=1 Tax=Leishmania major TaxID=5664 RepID=E9AE07_LEIMA|nr:conserved hypothetical protein [Leishmania major strain Friedlin]CAG9577885.1 hypothetical_protein_-_conserved [Leishmania major strain Friedlin]CBZ12486.1 conserved hypothetical protein [Leishmania major strain Friedlin]|eukprot:XP_003722228.1 conserved hypothetical protein [Leishmania major strain Friedlin]
MTKGSEYPFAAARIALLYRFKSVVCSSSVMRMSAVSQVPPRLLFFSFPVCTSYRFLSKLSVAPCVSTYVSPSGDGFVAKTKLRARAHTSGLHTAKNCRERESAPQPLVRATGSPSISVVMTRRTAAALAMPRSSAARPSYPASLSSQRLLRLAGICSTATSGLTCCRQVHIGHSTDVHRWRNPEKEEVQRQFRGGVKLGSHIAKVREQQAKEKELIEQDKFTDWRLVYNYSIGTALLLIGLNVILAFVEPNPSPEYVPYTESVVPASNVSNTMADSSQAPLSEAGPAKCT